MKSKMREGTAAEIEVLAREHGLSYGRYVYLYGGLVDAADFGTVLGDVSGGVGKREGDHVCLICGGKFYVTTVNQKYCSPGCAYEAALVRNRERRLRVKRPKLEKTCPICGKVFEVTGRQKFCSKECLAKSREIALENSEPKTCEFCGSEYKNLNPRSKYCSSACGARAMQRAHAASRRG
jgi:uncharacterized Zn-finger protein